MLANPESFSPIAPWGTQQSQGYIDTTSVRAIGYAAAGLTTISGLDQSAVARLVASGGDPKHPDAPGAFITSSGFLPAGATVVNIGALPQVVAPIASIANPSGGTITITTADTGTLAIGDLVVISGVSDSAINGRWIVTNVKAKTSSAPASFDLKNSSGDGTMIAPNTGTWTWSPAFVTFKTPPSWTPPTDNATHPFTFSIFSGTTVPTNITGPTAAAPGTVVTINGKGLTGVFGVSFNGYPGTIVGSSISSITNTIGSPIIINLPAGTSANGLSDGDTVTISGVIDLSTGKPAAVNGTWTVAYNPALTGFPNAFQLTGNGGNGNGDPLSGGSWIDGTDVAVKVIVPDTKSNATLPDGNTPTNPGPTGKIGVRNASGTAYSTADFTITAHLTVTPPPAAPPRALGRGAHEPDPRLSPGNRSP